METITIVSLANQLEKARQAHSAISEQQIRNGNDCLRAQASVDAATRAIHEAQSQLTACMTYLCKCQYESINTAPRVAEKQAEMQLAHLMLRLYPILEEAQGSPFCIGDLFEFKGAGLPSIRLYRLVDVGGLVQLIPSADARPAITYLVL